MSIAENIQNINERISISAKKSGRNFEDITLVAVSKTIEVSKIAQAVSFGITNLGENKAQELTDKFSQIQNVNWHLIGHLQTNKVKYIIDKAHLIHSVDSFKLAQEVNSHAKRIKKVQNILIQINISGEATKFGIPKNEVENLLESLQSLDSIRVLGLMTIPPAYATYDENKKLFEICNKLFIDIKSKKYHNICMEYLSMGMSGDFETAIEMGSNIVRVGTGIFGERKYIL